MRIGIVNDSRLAVQALRRLVEREHEVAWIATDGREALIATARQKPDLILMDLVMPELNGVEATRAIMRQHPCPILVVTATVSGNYALVYEALSAGAVDVVQTPTLGPQGEWIGSDELTRKLKHLDRRYGGLSTAFGRPAAGIPSEGSSEDFLTTSPSRNPGESSGSAGEGRSEVTADLPALIALGASTGGPQALADVLSAWPARFPAAVLVVMHIDRGFSLGLVEWLKARAALPVFPAAAGDRLKPGEIRVCTQEDWLTVSPSGQLNYRPLPADVTYRPNIDRFFQGLAPYPTSSLRAAILLTGMGRDGAEGLLSLKQAGWLTYAQSPSSCVVSGMPEAAIQLQAAVEILPPRSIGLDVLGQLQSRSRAKPHP